MTWLANHWAALVGWLTAVVTLAVVAVREWRLRRQVDRERASAVTARKLRDEATRRAVDAEAEARTVRAKLDALERLNQEARDARERAGSDLTDLISKRNAGG